MWTFFESLFIFFNNFLNKKKKKKIYNLGKYNVGEFGWDLDVGR